MNKEKEFEEKILNKLIIDLKDVDNYKSFKHGSFIYDLGYYQGNLLVNEIDRLNNIINEIKEYIKYQIENLDFEKDTKAKMLGCMILNMLKELKDGD